MLDPAPKWITHGNSGWAAEGLACIIELGSTEPAEKVAAKSETSSEMITSEWEHEDTFVEGERLESRSVEHCKLPTSPSDLATRRDYARR